MIKQDFQMEINMTLSTDKNKCTLGYILYTSDLRSHLNFVQFFISGNGFAYELCTCILCIDYTVIQATRKQ